MILSALKITTLWSGLRLHLCWCSLIQNSAQWKGVKQLADRYRNESHSAYYPEQHFINMSANDLIFWFEDFITTNVIFDGYLEYLPFLFAFAFVCILNKGSI